MAKKTPEMTTKRAQDVLEAALKRNEFDADAILSLTQGLLAADIRRALADNPGMNQNKLAEMLGCSKQNISQILNERKNLTLRTLAELCEVLRRHLVVRILAEDEASPVVPVWSLPDVRLAAQGLLRHEDKTAKKEYREVQLNYWKARLAVSRRSGAGLSLMLNTQGRPATDRTAEKTA